MRALAVVLLAAAAVLPRRVRWLVGALAGGALVHEEWTRGLPQHAGRVPAAVAVVVLAAVAAVVLSGVLPAADPPGGRWLMLIGAAAAAYACVPETDQFHELWVVLLAGLATETLGVARLPPAVFTAGWGLVAWAAIYGATGWPSAAVGGLTALLVPLAAAVAAQRRGGWAGVAVCAVWTVAAMVVARTGGISESWRTALVAAAAGVAGAVAISVWIASSRRWPAAPR